MVVKRETILKVIADELRCIKQWLNNDAVLGTTLYRATQSENQALALIELLEVEDCGSTGGYDQKNPLVNKFTNDLVNRFYTVCKKHKQLSFAKEVILMYELRKNETRNKS